LIPCLIPFHTANKTNRLVAVCYGTFLPWQTLLYIYKPKTKNVVYAILYTYIIQCERLGHTASG